MEGLICKKCSPAASWMICLNSCWQIVATLFHLLSYMEAFKEQDKVINILELSRGFEDVSVLWEAIFSLVVVGIYWQILHFFIRYSLTPLGVHFIAGSLQAGYVVQVRFLLK